MIRVLTLPYSVTILTYPTLFNFGNCEEELPKKPVGRLSVNCRPTVGRLLANCLPTVCVMFEAKVLADCRPTVGRQSVTCWQPVGNVSVNCRPTGGRQVFWGARLHNYLNFNDLTQEHIGVKRVILSTLFIFIATCPKS